jgi:hypothetical protein
VKGWLCWVGYAVADRAARHAHDPVGLRKYKGIQHLRNMNWPISGEVLRRYHTT